MYREITSSVLFGDVMVRNGIFWTIGEQSYIVYYPIISYRKIKVYRFKQLIWEDPTETMMSVGQICWNNGVSGTIVLIVRDKILW